jgi:hypothetical protein
MCHQKPRTCSVVVNTIRFFPHSQLIKGFVTKVTLRVPLVEHELLALPEHLSSTRILAGFALLDQKLSLMTSTQPIGTLVSVASIQPI